METWHATLPPNRPDLQNLALLTASLVSSCSSGRRRAAVLGCTPEYREVLRNHCLDVHLFDSSSKFKSISDAIVGGSANETFIEGDWLETLPRFEGKFDFICSHFTHGNVAYGLRSAFFRVVSNALVSTGIFFDVVFDPQETYSLNGIRRRFSRAPINLVTANDFNACGLFQADLSAKLGVVDIAACYEWLDALRDDQHLGELIDYTKRVTKPSGVWYYSPGRGPETLGYYEAFDCQGRIDEPLSTAFGSNNYTLISRKHDA